MTLEELKRVRVLRKQLEEKPEILAALRDSAERTTTAYKRDRIGKQSFTALDLSPHGNFAESRIERLIPGIIDGEKELAELQDEFEKAVTELTKNIQSEFSNPTEQTLMLYRYVACRSFKEISNILRYSYRYVYSLHDKAMKKILNQSEII